MFKTVLRPLVFTAAIVAAATCHAVDTRKIFESNDNRNLGVVAISSIGDVTYEAKCKRMKVQQVDAAMANSIDNKTVLQMYWNEVKSSEDAEAVFINIAIATLKQALMGLNTKTRIYAVKIPVAGMYDVTASFKGDLATRVASSLFCKFAPVGIS